MLTELTNYSGLSICVLRAFFSVYRALNLVNFCVKPLDVGGLESLDFVSLNCSAHFVINGECINRARKVCRFYCWSTTT